MATKLNSSNKIIFTCDRCKNTVEFFHGMTTYRMVYEQDHQRIINKDDVRSFCSQLCAREVYLTERKAN